MHLPLPSRKASLVVVGLLLVVALAVALPWLSPKRGVERSSRALAEALVEKDKEALAALLADNYSDGFGFDRAQAITAAFTFREHFVICTVTYEEPQLTLAADDRAAIIRALVRLDGQGSPVAQAAIQSSKNTATPTSFRWRRDSWKPWDWKLVSIDNPDAVRAMSRFQREAGAAGLGL